MKISFVLPGFVKIPMGGIKVVHEYANRLSARGHTVTLIYPAKIPQMGLLSSVRGAVVGVHDKLTGVIPSLYYSADPAVRVLNVKKPSSLYIPKGDCIVAVGWQTAEQVYRLPDIHGRKFYLLQSFETYFRKRKYVLKTYKLPLTKIAISSWIISEIEKIGETASGPVCNAVSDDEFYLTNPDDERKYHFMMIYHSHRIKGAKDGIKVLRILKKSFPNLRAVIVAPRKPVHRIPGWIDVEIRPSVSELRDIYNSAQIFLHTSHWEGWGLPVMEAMACGCAVAASDNRGIREYLVNGENAMISGIGNLGSMVNNSKILLENSELINKLISRGLETVKIYTWDTIINKLEEILTGEV